MTRTPKYYTYNKIMDKYQIKKRFGSEWKYFGYYPSETEAQRMVEELEKANWDIEKLPYGFRKVILIKLKKETPSRPKNYTFHNGYKQYNVSKMIKGKYNYYGFYDTEAEAIQVVEYLKQNNWKNNVL